MPIITCEVCEKPIKIPNCRVGIRRFCSNACRGISRKKNIVREDRTCPNCGRDFEAPANQTKHGYYKFCSNKCKYEYMRGVNSPSFKGGWVRPDGYRQVSHNSKQWLEHDLVYYLSTGIKPDRYHHIHHIDGNKLNNDISNLVMVDAEDHFARHPKSNETIHRMSEAMKMVAQGRSRGSDGRFLCSGS